MRRDECNWEELFIPILRKRRSFLTGMMEKLRLRRLLRMSQERLRKVQSVEKGKSPTTRNNDELLSHGQQSSATVTFSHSVVLSYPS